MTDFDPDSASSQLRVIRSLMERATIYRSLSAPTALVGGLLSFGGLGLAYAADPVRGKPLSDDEFLAIWLVILALTGLTNGFVLWREARRRSNPFFSAGMKCAFKSLLPPFLCAGVFTVCFPGPTWHAIFWIIFYGLGLLATQHFAPRSIVVLGLMFFLAGCLAFIAWVYFVPFGSEAMLSPLDASWLMALTFGLFHVVYAAAVWLLGETRAETPLTTPNGAENV